MTMLGCNAQSTPEVGLSEGDREERARCRKHPATHDCHQALVVNLVRAVQHELMAGTGNAQERKLAHLWVSDNMFDTLLQISGEGAHGSLWSTNNTSMVPA